MGKKSRNLTGSGEKKKISERIPQNFRLLAVFQVSGAFAYSSKAPICPSFLSYTGCPRRNVSIREGVPYVKVYRYNPKHLCPKLNGYGDNGQRSLKL